MGRPEKSGLCEPDDRRQRIKGHLCLYQKQILLCQSYGSAENACYLPSVLINASNEKAQLLILN